MAESFKLEAQNALNEITEKMSKISKQDLETIEQWLMAKHHRSSLNTGIFEGLAEYATFIGTMSALHYLATELRTLRGG